MTKRELVKVLAEKRVEKKVKVEQFVDMVFDTIAAELEKGEKVSIHGFGSFSIVERKGRKGVINFGEKKGETYTTEAKKAVKFQVATKLKNTVKAA